MLLSFFENNRIQQPGFVIIEFDHHEILPSSSRMLRSDQAQESISVFLAAISHAESQKRGERQKRLLLDAQSSHN